MPQALITRATLAVPAQPDCVATAHSGEHFDPGGWTQPLTPACSRSLAGWPVDDGGGIVPNRVGARHICIVGLGSGFLGVSAGSHGAWQAVGVMAMRRGSGVHLVVGLFLALPVAASAGDFKATRLAPSAAAGLRADFNGDGAADLAIGAPSEGLGPALPLGWCMCCTARPWADRRREPAVVTRQSRGRRRGRGRRWLWGRAGDRGFQRRRPRGFGRGRSERERHRRDGVWHRGGARAVRLGQWADRRREPAVVTRQPGVGGAAEAGDGFGGALAAGDFNADSPADLAVGVGQENKGAAWSMCSAGRRGADRNRKSAVVPRQWRGGRHC